MQTRPIMKREGSVIIPIPKALVERFGPREGDTVYLVETEAGILITPYDDETRKVLESYERTVHRYANALRKLAE